MFLDTVFFSAPSNTLLSSSNSASVTHAFVLNNRIRSGSLCSVISKMPISLQIAVIRFLYPLFAGSLLIKVSQNKFVNLLCLFHSGITTAFHSFCVDIFWSIFNFLLIFILSDLFYYYFALFNIYIFSHFIKI